jgi:hypothetical protein
MNGSSDPGREAREMLGAVWTLVHGDRPSWEAAQVFRWVALAAIPDGPVMVGGPYPSLNAGLAHVTETLDAAARAVGSGREGVGR